MMVNAIKICPILMIKFCVIYLICSISLFQGNLLLLGGFGNLRGNVEIWSCEKERKEVAKFEAPDSTDVRWSPSGKFLMTSTCAPRLRVGNGFRVWHYSRDVRLISVKNNVTELSFMD